MVSKKEKNTISCDGGKGSLGHPKIFLNLEKKDGVNCPYCGKHFIREKTKKNNKE